jgi:hypothetical protein
MHCNNDDIVSRSAMHNPQYPAAECGDRFVGSRTLRVPRIAFDKVRRVHRLLDPSQGDATGSYCFLCMLCQAYHGYRVNEP